MITDVQNMIVMGKSGSGKQPRVDVLIRRFGLKQLSTGDIFRHYLGLFGKVGFEGDLAQFISEETGAFIADEEIKEKLGVAGDANADDVLLGAKASYYVNKGLFVPDEITNALFESGFQAMDFKGAVLDGFPRTVEQAEFLINLMNREDFSLDGIILVDNEDELIINRTLGRRICKNCGELYHMEFRPPPADGKCEGCGSTNIVQRSDDNVESLKSRLSEFRTKTEPAIEYMKEKGIPFYLVPGNLPDYSPARVTASVYEILGIEPE